MSTVDQILELMMKQGDIEANRIKEDAAWKEEIKRAKNAWKGNTLKALATIGTMFIPGLGPLGGVWTAAGRAGLGLGKVAGTLATGAVTSSLTDALRDKSSDPFGALSGTKNAGLGFNQFAGPMSKSSFSSQAQGDPYNPWDDEPI